MKNFKRIKQDIYERRKGLDSILEAYLEKLEKADIDYDERVRTIKVIKNIARYKSECEEDYQELYELMGENKGIWIGAAAFASGLFIGKVITTILCRK